ncbi:MAG TPA: hypothetical protein VHC47_09290 [Mucilaginibacter sp.]|nr:hypothetical protein [Mucilaginibacter sp.]
MHIDYCAPREKGSACTDPNPTEHLLRCRAYAEACRKHSRYIAEIQQYLPGWMPVPPTPLKKAQ